MPNVFIGLSKLFLPLLGLIIGALGVICLAWPDKFLKINKALSHQVTLVNKIPLPFRLFLGLGLVWLGVFLARLPRYLR